jgi:signal transduction histidine kinase
MAAWWPALRGPILVAIAYYLGAQAAFYIGTLSDKIFAPFWPPNMILFCALLVASERRWWLFIAAAFPAHAIAEFQVGMPAPQMLIAFASNCMVAVLNGFAVRRLLEHPPWLGDLRKASLYVLATAVINPALAAFVGAFVPILGGGAIDKFWLFWTNWYLSNVLTSLTLGPIFLSWLSERPTAAWLKPTLSKAEAILLGLALVIVCTVVFEVSARNVATGFLPVVLYSPLPLILWSTMRFGEKGASAAILIVTVVLIWRTLQGPSLFVGADPETNVLTLQLFLAGLSIPVVLLGAAIDELRRAAHTTRELARSVLTAQDEERRRIARELHDSTGQNLIGAHMLVNRIRDVVPASSARVVDQLDDTLRQSIAEVRTVSYLLHPPLLDESGLDLALRHYIEGFGQRSGVAVSLDMSSTVGRLPAETEIALFRVVQEALTNVSRHSGSATASVRLRRERRNGTASVFLTIEDAGKGIAAFARRHGSGAPRQRAVNGVGLDSMRERLDQLGGRLEVDSRVGRTVVTAIVPLEAGHQ